MASANLGLTEMGISAMQNTANGPRVGIVSMLLAASQIEKLRFDGPLVVKNVPARFMHSVLAEM